MSISTYAELQTAIANWLNDSNLTSRIPEFITIAEGRINRKLRSLQQEKEATASYDPANSSRFIQLPTGYLEMIDLRIKKSSDADTEYVPVQMLPPEHLVDKYADAGKPEFFTVRNQIEFNRLPDVVYTLRQHYLKGLDLATDLSNSLLTDHPDVYLYGSLVAAEGFLINDQRIPTWKMMFEEAIQEVNDLDNRSRDDGVLSTDELASMNFNRGGYDITYG